MPPIAYAAVVVLIVANVALNLAVLRTASYSTGQKTVQSLLIWLLPLLGPLLVWVMWTQIQHEGAANVRRPDHFADPFAADGPYSQGAPFSGDAGGGDHAGGSGGDSH
jgi:hypothetical protein